MMGRQQHPHCFLVLLLVVFIAGIALTGPSTPRRSRVRRQNMKVRINATGDTIVMKFLRPNSDTKLEGYILGYGSSMFSKQFIQLPENGQPYLTEFDAEPKYLIAVQPIPVNDVKKQCTGKVELEKPLHLVIGSVTPTSVLLSWGTLLKTPYESNVMNDCLEDGHYTVRYRERNRKWNYQTCPTSDTVIDHLKPNTVYEFGVQPNSKDGTGLWSKPVHHNITSGGLEEKAIRKIFKHPVTSGKALTTGPLSFPFGPRHAGGDHYRSILPPSLEIPLAPILHSPLHITTTMRPMPLPQKDVDKDGYSLSQPEIIPQSQQNTEPPPNPQTQPEYPHPPRSKPSTPKPQPKNFSKAQPQPHPQPILHLIAKAQPQTTSQPIPHTQQMQPKPGFQFQPQTKPHTQPTVKRISDTHPKPHTQPESKLMSEMKPEPHSTTQTTSQIQQKPQPESKPIPKPKPQPQAKIPPIPKTQPQPQPHPQYKPTPKIQPQPQPQPESKPIPKKKPQPQPQTTPMPKTKPQPQAKIKSTPKTKPQLQSESKSVPQTKLKPQPPSQPTSQTRPHPQPQPAPKPILKTESEPRPTSQAISDILTQTQSLPESGLLHQTHPQPQAGPANHQVLQSKPKPLSTPQPILTTFSQSQPHPKLVLRSETQTTTGLPVELKLQPTPKLKHQIHSHTQPYLKTQTQPKVRTTTQPTYMAHPQTHQPTLKHTPKTPEALPKVNTKPQPQPRSQNTTKTQTQTQPQPKTDPQPQPEKNPDTKLTDGQKSKIQVTPKPKTNILHPKPKKQIQNKGQSKPSTQPRPKSQSKPGTEPRPKSQSKPGTEPRPKSQSKPGTEPRPKSQSKPQQPNPQPKVQQPKTKIKQKSQSQHPIKTQTPPAPHSQPILQPQPLPKADPKSPHYTLPKPHPASSPKQQSQPGNHSESQSWSYSDTTEVTPRKAFATASSPPEEGKPLPRPALATEEADSYNLGTGAIKSSVAEVPQSSISTSVSQAGRNSTVSRSRVPPNPNRKTVRPFSPSKTFSSSQSSSSPGALGGAHHRGNALPKPAMWPREKPVLRPSIPVNKRPNLVGKPSDHDKPMDLKQGEKESILKPFPLVTAKPKQERRQQTTTTAPALNSSRFDINENSSIFRPLPASEVDIMGKKRFVAPHVIYKTDKKPDEPCSITSSLAYFPDEEGADQNVTGPPRVPPSNLTVVTVEGCPSFVILDWQKSDNETREYEVVSTTKGPNGEEVSVLTTNQTHTAVENLKPESSYEFTVTPRNELGTGPSSDPVSFNTESADPRVSENVSGKDAIWTQFPFKSDSYSECNGKQYVKRTWYRKFVGIQLCNSLRYKIYLSDSLNGKFYNIGDQTGHGEDHCQFVDSFLDGRTGTQMLADQLPSRPGFYRALRQEPVHFGEIGGKSHVTYVGWYECGTPIPGKW
ncbi:target of Nesh-SH3 isoform X2 [Notolabrus celidotus]|uniref:target of Nesh-SH3 isoform X2 n=1 Tax=Notolabrus celidotus TaxID=1203425 RepID=UPI001490816A|nr:target of Nesh-SH3 isoform X2 [Notolabrus celidotus]